MDRRPPILRRPPVSPALTLALALLAPLVGASQPIWHVDADVVGGAADGSSWADAFATLDAALAVADIGDEVRVAAGRYVPAGGREASFLLPGGVKLLGGFAGFGAPDPDARDPLLHETVLSGDLAGDDLPGFGNREDNAWHVVSTTPGAPQPFLLEGLTVSGGQADGALPMGGGLLLRENTVVVVDCRIVDNHADQRGGGLYAHGCQLTLRRCELGANRVAVPADSPPGLHVAGGGAYSVGGDVTVDGCDVHDNLADKPLVDPLADGFGAAGMALEQGSAALVVRTRFAHNVASAVETIGHGGALAVEISGPTVAVVKDCDFVGNLYAAAARSFYDGGAGAWIDAHLGAELRVTNCRFLGNAAPDGKGGGLYAVDGTQVTHCVFSGNSAREGGGLFNSTPLAVVGCSVVGNTAGEAGGGISAAAMGSIDNSVLWGNADAGGVDESAQVHAGGLPPAVSYSAVQGFSGGMPGFGSHGLDPRLADPAGPDGLPGSEDDDLRLTAGSACIDVGSNLAVPADLVDADWDLDQSEPLPIDVAGRVRFHDDLATPDGGAGGGPVVDMGAYEFGAPLPAQQWTDVGFALPGSAGAAQLTGGGTLGPGELFELGLSGALPDTGVVLVIGLFPVNLPLKGGTLVPKDSLLVLGLTTDVLGELTLGLPWVDGVAPGVSLWWQAWFQDAGAPQGWAASNGIRSTTPDGA